MFRIYLFYAIFASFLCSVIVSEKAYAQAADPFCDAEIMDAFEARANLEGHRELAQIQNFVTKPDSTLEYTCFDQFGSVLKTAPLRVGPALLALHAEIQYLVVDTLSAYLNSNYPHNLLGGRAAIAGPAFSAAPEYTCDVMARIWEIARCTNFTDYPSNDGFFDFPWYAANDPRIFPGAPDFAMCPSSAPSINAALNTAFNNDVIPHVINPENANDPVPYTDEPFSGDFAILLPKGKINPETGSPVTCAPPIPTGVDFICPNPGCVYNGSTCE